MTTTPLLDLARLNAVTDAASAGPWHVNDPTDTMHALKTMRGMTIADIGYSGSEAQDKANGEFFSAFNPQTARLLLDRIEQLENPWQPIETAPKDGTHIMLTDGQQVLQGWWMYEEPYTREMRDMDGHYVDQAESDGYDDWFDCEGGSIVTPTHWMPLPTAPKLEQTK